MLEVSVPCGACGKPIRGGDAFCEACGARVGEDLKRALRERLEVSHSDYAEHAKQLRNARAIIGVLSALFVVGGVVLFLVTRSQTDDALASLHGADDTPVAHSIAGASTVGELRDVLARRPWQVLGLNLFLAAVMLGLWIWSKRALLPAIFTALGVYVAVIVGSALYDASTIVQGLPMKIVVIVALVKGVQSTLAARKLEIAR